MPFASEQERDVADQVLKTLLSEKYKPKNYLFLEPFDLNEVPDYLETVGKPLNLRSIAERFYQDLYDASGFWSDVENVYKNAIKYHGGKPASKWIAKFAKDMLKNVIKERANIENPSEKKPKAKIKVKLKASPEGSGTGPTQASAADHTPSAHMESLPPKPKTKLKLQLPKASSSLSPGGSSSSLHDQTVSPSSSATLDTAAKRPKFKIKLSNKGSDADSSLPVPTPAMSSTSVPDTNTSSSVLSAAPGAMTTADGSTKSVPKKAKPSQPKFKLKLSLKKPLTAGTGAPKISKKPQQSAPKTEIYNDNDDEEEGEVKQDTSPVRPQAVVPETKPIAPPQAQQIRIPAPVGPSRGKELPQGVVAPLPPVPSIPKPKKPKKASSTAKKAPPVSTPAVTAGGVAVAPAPTQPGCLDLQQTKQCCKVTLGLKRRKNKQISWFLMPVSDKSILPDYKSKIKSPMDLHTIQSKLDKGSYRKLDAFCLDLRRVFANALRYNTSIKDSLRPLAVEVLQSAESLMLTFISRYYQLSYPPLLYCWKVCIDILDTLYNLVNPTDGQPMAYYFLHPVSVYFGGKFPTDYLEKVKKPMDFGTITANLLEGRYQTVDAFSSDCRLVVQNCQTYYQSKDESRVFLDQATQLNDCLTSQLLQLARYDKSMKGDSERRKVAQLTNQSRIMQEMILPNQPPAALFLSVLEDLRALKYTDKGTKITEPAMGPFEKSVSTIDFPDYLQFVLEPLDLQAIEKKVKLGTVYETPEDFEYDMLLVFKNCEVYNSRRNAQHSVSMAKFGSRKFRSVFNAKMQAYEDPTSVSPTKVQMTVTPLQPADNEQAQHSAPPAKKIKLDTSATSKGKSAPKISTTVAQVSSSTANSAVAVARAKSPSTTQPRPTTQPKLDQPVPLHIAIAKVKEAFPLRRAVKSLQSWEADCARYFKEMMRHPWISATRPKFVFSCPVPILFPELREHYALKIKKSMDLTTIECTLLAGNRYAGVEDFIQDVALVFANAIRFNKDGKDIGDPLSSAYYDASVHLLRYSRWLSFELLSNHIDDSDHTDLPSPDKLPPLSWKLTSGNRNVARQEIEAVVLKEPMEKSLEGDRYTWMEAECEKLLKALRHQSDLRYMTFFIQPNYPPDYTAFIPKPMDWEKVQRTLKKRHYDTVGSLIDDLRLIFSNAERYNSRLKGTDTVSGRAYEAGKYMSEKLELAINRLLLSVSDRLERERIDHTNAEREIEAAERAEEDEIRAAWKKDPDRVEASSVTARSEVMAQRIRIVRRAPQRRQSTDFEIPFFDEEDDGLHERSYFEVVKFQKVMFEKQRQEQSKMRKISSGIGVSVLARLVQRNVVEEEIASTAPAPLTPIEESHSKTNDAHGFNDSASSKPSDVLSELEREGRSRFQIQFMTKMKPKALPKRKCAFQ